VSFRQKLGLEQAILHASFEIGWVDAAGLSPEYESTLRPRHLISGGKILIRLADSKTDLNTLPKNACHAWYS